MRRNQVNDMHQLNTNFIVFRYTPVPHTTIIFITIRKVEPYIR